MDALEKNVPIERITFSSDGNGGVRKENRETGEVSYNPAPLDLNFKEIRALVKECDLPLEEALKLITSNPAAQMHLFQKGRIAVGNDADFCILNDDLDLSGVIAKGTVFMDDGKIIRKGRYEK
jgi:beta-aspartyl-dipeptidase (metallo-type)